MIALEASSPSEPVIIRLTALILVFFLTLPALHSTLRRAIFAQKRKTAGFLSECYEDEDGVATKQAQRAYSTTIPKYSALAFTSIGLIVSIASNVYSELEPVVTSRLEDWFTFGSWALLLTQVIYVVSLHAPIKTFDYGCLAAVAGAALSAAIIAGEGFRLQKSNGSQKFNMLLLLDAVQFFCGLMSFLSLFSIPRRPSLVLSGHAVDGQYTVSALSRYTYGWAGGVLKLARTVKFLDLRTIPKLHMHIRSVYLESRMSRGSKDNRHLLRNLLSVHARTIIFQTLFATGSAIVTFSPQAVMFTLLQLLEHPEDMPRFTKAAWTLVALLGLSLLAAAWGETWTHWMYMTRLGLPIRSELSAMIFSKAMRRKDVKGTQTRKDQTPSEDSLSLATIPTSPLSVDGGTTAIPNEDDVQKSRQATINLVGVDTKRISDLALYSFIFPITFTKMIVSVLFLLQLVGWQSLLAGFGIFLVVLPVNMIVSKKFTSAQSRLMKVRDKKLVIVTEALQGIRQIKFSAQEQQWQDKIGAARKEELATQWKVFCLDTCIIAIWILGPVMLSAVSLAIYAYIHGSLSAAVAFTSLSVFGSLEMALAVIPELISDGLEAYVSVKRINDYLNAPEKEAKFVSSPEIVFQDASIAWPSDKEGSGDDRFVLRHINIAFPKHELSVVSGATGSGKSLLLASLIGEADQLSGLVARPEPPISTDRYDYLANKSDWILDSAIAFVAQIPWIENATIKENILFGFPFDVGRYKRVLYSCALEKDFDILPDGDQTDIGANGINLSGGQRWRVSFARALYSRAEILVLDDVFSAVDAHVGRHLYAEALNGELCQGRTRILVTHHVGLCLPKACYSVVLGSGTVQYAGIPNEQEALKIINESVQQSTKKEAQEHGHDLIEAQGGGKLRKVLSHSSQRSIKIDEGELDTQGKQQPKKFTEEERREYGSVKIGIYREYLSSSGGVWFWSPLVVLCIFHQGIIVSRSWFISTWTRSYETHSSLQIQHTVSPSVVFLIKDSITSKLSGDPDLPYYLGVYVGISIAVCILGALRFFLIFVASLGASKRLFENITFAVLRAPLRWLDTVPVGRILNRMTADFNLIDSELGIHIGFLLVQVIQLLGIIFAGLFVSPWMLLFAVILLILCAKITVLYLTGAREVKRIDSNAKSPIFEQFGSALTGIGTIRAFDKSEEYIARMFDKIDAYCRTSWHLTLFNQWLVFRLNMVGALFAILITAVIVHNRIKASLAGFALSFALQYSSSLIWSAKQYADVELSMNAVERVSEYAKIPIEDQTEIVPAPAAWPTEGLLEFDNLVAGYAPDLPPVLKGLSFRVEPNQRIGIVGRTGAGKSSLTLALFRFLHPRSGAIRIDGIDISTISLHTLRSRLAIIPQDPVLFSGTVRSNLDPFNNHTDADLNDALARVHLTSPSPTPTNPNPNPSNSTNTISLAHPVSESGLNLSQGQRQLLTLARALVLRPKILVLDEATSAVDMETDQLIQRSIREELGGVTLVVIAHRLSTVEDFDRILVMDGGVGVEFGEPGELGRKEGGWWRGMWEGQRGVGRR